MGWSNSMSRGVCLGSCHLIAETEDAIYVLLEQQLQYRWIPKSQIHTNSDQLGPHLRDGYVTVTEWLAEREGWTQCGF